MEITSEKINDLKNRLFSRLNSSVVKQEKDVINLYELKSILSKYLKEYNELFFNKTEKYINKYNNKQKLTNLIKYKNPYISKIVPSIKDNESKLEIYLVNNLGKYDGMIELNYDIDHPELYDLDSSHETYDKINKLISDNKLLLLTLLASLEVFKKENPNINYTWDKDVINEYDRQTIDDGFICSNISLNNITNIKANFSSKEDLMLSRVDTREDGELYDYLEFYNDEILKKTKVNIDDLNPLYKYFVDKELYYDKPRTLKK